MSGGERAALMALAGPRGVGGWWEECADVLPRAAREALDTARRLIRRPLILPFGDREAPVGEDFRRLPGANGQLQESLASRKTLMLL